MRLKAITFLCFCFILKIAAQPTIQLEEIAEGFITPVDIAHSDDDRLFVVEQRGLIKVIEVDGTVLDRPFLNLTSKVSFGGERGLLGLAFHPDYSNNGLFYVNYSNASGATHISSFKVSDDPNFTNTNSEQVLLIINQPFSNHNGGCLKFGADGYLYIGLGDGGSSRDPQDNGQNNEVLLGKMLRIELGAGNTYDIPSDNPFLNNPNIPDEIWGTGLRNPWRYSFDRLTEELWIADVGQNSFEEINRVPANSNEGIDFGWRCYEGNVILNANGCANMDQFQFPIFTYPTRFDVGLSITGGYVYRGTENPSLFGKYFYGDYITGRIWTLTPTTNGDFENEEVLKIGNNEISSFGENATGELFMAAYSSGKIFKIKQLTSTNIPATNDLAEIQLYPNPVTDQLTIQISTTNERNLNFELYNLMGAKLLEKNRSVLGQTTEVFSFKNLPAGTYFLKIKSKEEGTIRKVIKW